MDTSGNTVNSSTHKYNTRYKGKAISFNMKSETKNINKKEDSESSSDSDADSDYDSQVEDKEFKKKDNSEEEYQKFLNDIFPSQYQQEKINSLKRKKEMPSCNIIIAKSNFINRKKSYLNHFTEPGAGIGSNEEDHQLEEQDDPYPSSFNRLNQKNKDTDKEDEKNKRKKDMVIKKFQNLSYLMKKKNKNKLIEDIVKIANEEWKANKKQKNATKFEKLLFNDVELCDINYFKKQLKEEEQEKLINELKKVNSLTKIDKPYRIQVLDLDIPPNFKVIALKKLTMLESIDPSSGEYFKLKNWIDTFMRIPFGKINQFPISINNGIEKCSDYMQNAVKILDEAVYGLNDAKLQIMQLFGQWISNPDAIGSAIAIKGPMGTGKTTLVKYGISKMLNRPFSLIALGGATDASVLEGHGYTYEGSMYGKIVDILIQTKCSNPIIYFDELDKVSDTPKGEEIIGILTHLIDSTQNNQFHDKYFSEIDFDLSKALFIFSYNDESRINPILRDRMYRISTKGYKKDDKKVIAKNYLIPSICNQIKFKNDDIILSDETIEYIVENFTEKEDGVRNLKRCLETIFTKLNLYRLMKPGTSLFKEEVLFDIEFPFTITNSIVDKLIKKEEVQNNNWKAMYM
tara:strand:+ start:4631 stop:6517 length:1887 start_codon:yes stop_codon:yes gene_type:complete